MFYFKFIKHSHNNNKTTQSCRGVDGGGDDVIVACSVVIGHALHEGTDGRVVGVAQGSTHQQQRGNRHSGKKGVCGFVACIQDIIN